MAAQDGKAITFMAKFDEREGNSCHIHLSLRGSDGSIVFDEEEGLFDRFLAGMLAGLRELTPCSAPAASTARRSSRRAATPAWSAPACPRGGEVVLSTARLDRARRRSTAPPRRSTAGAGVDARARCRRSARAAGLDAGVDFGARDSATVGGLVATNAGGIRAHALRDDARARRRAARRCSPTASIIERLDGLLKDNAGYDLSALLVGSEGTLGDHHRASAGGWCRGSPAAWRR